MRLARAREEIVLANPLFHAGPQTAPCAWWAPRSAALRVKLLIGRKEFRLLDYAVAASLRDAAARRRADRRI
ncbi:MAG: hypothetical protein WDN30_02055 [Pararobbsia sp.]